MGCVLDWCGGGKWPDVERLYSLCFAILSNKAENRECFDDLPHYSTVKPFFLDHSFTKTVVEMASKNFELMTLATR